MKILTRKDTLSALVTGLTTGIVAWRILVYLDIGLPLGIPTWTLAVAVPAIWIFGVQLGYTVSAYWRPMAQFGRFAAIGFANTAVDFGLLYVFIGLTDLAAGSAYALFKAFSFTVATVHSYFWNKFWAFEAGASRGGSREVARFAAVALASVLVNTVTASVVVALRPGAIAAAPWAGVGAAAGSAVALIFSFIGFRVFVFRKKQV